MTQDLQQQQQQQQQLEAEEREKALQAAFAKTIEEAGTPEYAEAMLAYMELAETQGEVDKDGLWRPPAPVETMTDEELAAVAQALDSPYNFEFGLRGRRR